MTRRKSVCLKWTLVLVLFVFCPFVHPRPQDTSQSLTNSSSILDVVKPTENPIRYRYRNVSNRPKSTLDLSVSDLNRNFTNNSITLDLSTTFLPNGHLKGNDSNLLTHRLSRVIRHRNKNRVKNGSQQKDGKRSTSRPQVVNDLKRSNKGNGAQKDLIAVSRDKNKPVIKKVVTKWTDNAKYEGLDFSYETNASNENEMGKIKNGNILAQSEYDSTENNGEDSGEVSDKRYPDKRYRPRPQYSEETQVYTSNVQIVDGYPFPSTRPPYIFNTPTPTPIITNVGYPQPWPQPQPVYQVYQPRPTTPTPIKTAKPVKDPYNYHNTFQNNYPSYPGNNFEVTTFQPTTAYTDRIVIRPEEYSASPDDCPTIFLTLNNTFQGQGKEACPDLNIAVNTNVINKNVVVDSDEDNDASFTDTFGLPLADDSDSEEIPQDYFESAENQEEESASVEATGLTNYNAANVAESAEPAGFGSPSAPLSALSRPGKPNDDDDDTFGLSSIISFFKPALSAFGWLATINPLSFGIVSLVLAPLVLLIAGTSGVAALFAPWAFSYAREAPKVVHIYRPQWQWDDDDKTWQLNSFPDRQWRPTSPRINGENAMRSSVRTTWFYKLKEAMKALTRRLRVIKNDAVQENRKSKRKKRETWTIRVK